MLIKDPLIEEMKKVRQFGNVGCVFFLIIASLAYWRGHERTTYVFGGLSACFIVLTFLAPRLMRLVFKGWMAVVGVIAWVNRQVLLSLVFFVLVTPTAFFLRLLGRDYMNRRFDHEASSYWTPHADVSADASAYERRF